MRAFGCTRSWCTWFSRALGFVKPASSKSGVFRAATGLELYRLQARLVGAAYGWQELARH